VVAAAVLGHLGHDAQEVRLLTKDRDDAEQAAERVC
jgi:hypothetical protein